MTAAGHGAALIAGDPHDGTLLGQVHPTPWENPAPGGRYHLVVIGAGTGGLVTAAIAAGLGARVALVERHLMGGDCLNAGCVPSKGLLAAARGWHAAATAADRFGGPAVTGEGDFSRAAARMRAIRAALSPIDSAARFRALGVDVFLGHGRFAGPDVVEVSGARLRFRRAVIATGARPAVPPVAGLADVGYLTNETVFTLTERPRHLLVLGGGPIGCELAQAFRRFGSAVTVVTRDQRLLPRDDPRASAAVAGRFAAEGIRVVAGASVRRATREGDDRVLEVAADGRVEHLRGDQLLVATGRAPNVEDLGLEHANVTVTGHGVAVDDRLRTSNPAVYAVGDVCSQWRFTHAADAHARLVVRNALFFGRARASALMVPWCTYTSPEVAQVGMTEAEAGQAGRAVDVVEVGLEHVDRAALDGETDGFLKVVLARGTDRILGVTIVAPNAGELVSQATLAMTSRLGLAAMGRTIHPYPTYAEAFRKAADQWQRRKLTPFARLLLERWFAAFR